MAPQDECVTVKSPSKNILVESIYCNWSGGCAMGSLGSGVEVSDITYRNIYTYKSNQEFMVSARQEQVMEFLNLFFICFSFCGLLMLVYHSDQKQWRRWHCIQHRPREFHR